MLDPQTTEPELQILKIIITISIANKANFVKVCLKDKQFYGNSYTMITV